MAKADIGVIGLAVMGENLILNMESKGFTVACYNRTVSKVDDFVEGRAKGKKIIGTHSIEELCDALARPRKVMLMVKAGQPVDDFIELLLPHLEQGDIIIDGGNSYFRRHHPPHPVPGGKGPALHRHRRLGRRGGRAATGRASCPAAARRPGRTSSRSSRPSPPRWPTARPAATGWAATAPATMSRWCTTASSMATCR